MMVPVDWFLYCSEKWVSKQIMTKWYHCPGGYFWVWSSLDRYDTIKPWGPLHLKHPRTSSPQPARRHLAGFLFWNYYGYLDISILHPYRPFALKNDPRIFTNPSRITVSKHRFHDYPQTILFDGFCSLWVCFRWTLDKKQSPMPAKRISD